MAEQNPAPTTETVEAPVAPEQTTSQQAADQGQAEFNAAAARKKLKALERENADMAKRLAEREEASKSEEEKKLAAERKAGRAEVEGELAKIRLDHAMERELLKRGLDPDLKHIVLAKGDVSSEDDVADAITAALGDKEWAKPRANGSQGAPNRDATKGEFPRGGQWDRSQVQEVIARGEYDKYREEIERAYGVRR